MKKYINCDGVILDTKSGLFDRYYELKKQNPALNKRLYLQEFDWKKWINNVKVINNGIKILREYDFYENDILTRVHSMEEAVAKIEYFRERKIKNNIVIVPYGAKNSNVVSACANLLIDDNEISLREWQVQSGLGIYFGTDVSCYLTIHSLDEVLDRLKFETLLQSM